LTVDVMEEITSDAILNFVAVGDAVPARDPGEISVGNPHIALGVLIDEQPARPVKPGIWIGGKKQRAERRIAEHEQRRRQELHACVGGELRLIDLVEKHDALVGDILLQALDSLGHVVGALELDDAVIVGGVYRAKGRHFSANVTGAAEQSERMSMGLLLKRGRRDFKLVSHNMAKRLAKLKCRFASNSIPQAMVALGWKLLTMRKLDARYGVAREGKPDRNG
jgi:hypothetical protein